MRLTPCARGVDFDIFRPQPEPHFVQVFEYRGCDPDLGEAKGRGPDRQDVI